MAPQGSPRSPFRVAISTIVRLPRDPPPRTPRPHAPHPPHPGSSSHAPPAATRFPRLGCTIRNDTLVTAQRRDEAKDQAPRPGIHQQAQNCSAASPSSRRPHHRTATACPWAHTALSAGMLPHIPSWQIPCVKALLQCHLCQEAFPCLTDRTASLPITLDVFHTCGVTTGTCGSLPQA